MIGTERLERARSAFTTAPEYPATDADRRTFRVLGLELPLRATVAILVIGANPQFSYYYGISSAPIGDLLVTHLLDLAPTEFLLRGFVMFTLLRTIGPIGVVVAQLPFVFVHLGKPEIELFSTLFGGMVFGWLDWRTRSIWWSALGHTYILTLVVAVAGAAVTG